MNEAKMKILYISYHGLTEPLGQSTVLPYLLSLSQAQMEVYLLSFEKTKDKKIIEETKNILTRQNISWIQLFYHKKPLIISTLLDMTLGVFKAIWTIKKEKINIVHAQGDIPAFITLPLKILFNVKFIFDADGFWALERKEIKIWKNHLYLYKAVSFLEKCVYRHIDILIVLTNKAKEIVAGPEYLNGRKIPILLKRTCVNTDHFYPQDQAVLKKTHQLENKIILIYVGSIGTWYMLDEMLEFFKIFKQQHSQSLFIILTSEENISSLKDKIQSLNLDLSDFKIASVTHGQVPQWINLADIGIYFITPIASKQGSSPTKLGEMLACGKPIITNRGIGDCDEILEEKKTAVFVESFEKESYLKAAQEISNLIKETDIKERCLQTAQKHLDIKNAQLVYQKIYQLIKNHNQAN